MKLTVIFILSLFLLSACTQPSEHGLGKLSGENPFEYCRSLELADNTEEYQQCVASKINEICTSHGAIPGSDAYAKCEHDLRKATFVRQQMQIRGF